MDKKITVIVPVYNVEKYLDRCIRSLVNQTSDNYKILIVDDGSTDGSCLLCDKWSNESKSIKAVHKNNGGLSDARNYGVSLVDTDFVTFVDADDYVEPQYIELLEQGIQLCADIVVTNHIQEYDDYPKPARIEGDYCIVSSKEALRLMCYEKISTSAWGKLFPTSYVREHPFPKGKLYEDLLTVYKYLGKADTIAINNSQSYHYIQRKGSIRQSNWSEKCFDVMEGADNLFDFIQNQYPDLYKAGVFRYFYSANELFVRAFLSDKYLDIVHPIRKKLKALIRDLVSNRDASIKHRIQFVLMTYLPNLYRYIWMQKKRSL